MIGARKCVTCGTEKCPACGHEEKCCGGGAGGCSFIDPLAQAPTRDKTTIWNVTTLTTQWQEFNFPVDMIVKPTSYGGGSQNSYTGIQVVSGNIPQQLAGVDTPWEVVSAGKAFALPCGTYNMRANNSANLINVRIYPAGVKELKGLSRAFMTTPTFATVGVASANAVLARVGRAVLILTNTSSGNISIAFGAAAAVLNSGITILPGATIALYDDDCPEDAMQAIAAGANANLAIQEG
jgi:hypothetical protein